MNSSYCGHRDKIHGGGWGGQGKFTKWIETSSELEKVLKE